MLFPIEESETPSVFLEHYFDSVDSIVTEYGAVLLRGFNIHSVSEFHRFALSYSPDLLAYTNRSSPRTPLGGNIYTSTEYPSNMVIPQHNENSYTNAWHSILLFKCVVSAHTGGETPLADSRKILSLLSDDLVAGLDDKGVMYVRNYTPGLDLSWQEVFQTESKSEVNKYCDTNNIEFEWLYNDERLRTKQMLQATTYHPKTNEKVWLNQINLFHISATGEYGERLDDEYGIENVPRNVFYGDGTTIPVCPSRNGA